MSADFKSRYLKIISEDNILTTMIITNASMAELSQLLENGKVQPRAF